MVRMVSGNDNIDASVGLSFSLALFQRYHRTGFLKAEIHHVPGIPGPCKAYIHLIDGFVSSCIIINKRGQHIPSHQSILCQLDDERGPFEWRFQAPSSSPSSDTEKRQITTLRPQKTANHADTPGTRGERATPAHLEIDNRAVPRILSYPQWNMLHTWSPSHKRMLYDVLTAIDGIRTIQEIKMNLSLSDALMQDALHVLLKLKVISLA